MATKISPRASARCQRANPCKIEHTFCLPATFVGWNFGGKLFVEVKSIFVQPVRGEMRRQPLASAGRVM